MVLARSNIVTINVSAPAPAPPAPTPTTWQLTLTVDKTDVVVGDEVTFTLVVKGLYNTLAKVQLKCIESPIGSFALEAKETDTTGRATWKYKFAQAGTWRFQAELLEAGVPEDVWTAIGY